MSETESVQELGIQEGYARWAATYDQERNFLVILEKLFVDRILAQISFSNVLDVGAGTGRYALELARKGAHVTALDQSPEMLAVARQAAQRENLPINFHLAVLDDNLPFDADQFDLLICALVLCHVADMKRAVQEFARVLQSGGYLLITDFHPAHTSYGWLTSFKQAGVKYELPNIPYTREDYLEAISASGLKILEVVELPFRALPETYHSDEIVRLHSDKLLCLIILARK
jgi:ubiquinone/menaquinone biosynthesis C-methylase UbiE